MALSKFTLKVLADITGETVVEKAIGSTLRDALEHRTEMVEKGMKNFEKKYGMKFSEFKKRWNKMKNRFSYSVERDYIEWETLVTRKKKLKEASRWVK